MKLSDGIKHTRLHRFYRVVFLGLIIVSIPVAVYSGWSQPRLVQNIRVAEADAVAKHYSDQVLVWTRDEFLQRIELRNRMFDVALLMFILALFLPFLYRYFSTFCMVPPLFVGISTHGLNLKKSLREEERVRQGIVDSQVETIRKRLDEGVNRRGSQWALRPQIERFCLQHFRN